VRAEEGDVNIPANWKDDGTTLTAPNGVTVVRGFRAKVLEGWDANNLPLEKERAVNPVEHANPMVGGGTVQTFAHSRLAWTPARGVYLIPIGVELLFMEGKRVSTGPALPG
jgi:hypothetical protein